MKKNEKATLAYCEHRLRVTTLLKKLQQHVFNEQIENLNWGDVAVMKKAADDLAALAVLLRAEA